MGREPHSAAVEPLLLSPRAVGLGTNSPVTGFDVDGRTGVQRQRASPDSIGP